MNKHVGDPRSRRGRQLQWRSPKVTWAFGSSGFLGTLFAGMLAGCRGMRDVEELSEELDVRDTDGRPVDKISDTALGNVAAEINPDDPGDDWEVSEERRSSSPTSCGTT